MRLTTCLHPSRSGLVIAPMDAAWLADSKWVRLRRMLPEDRCFFAAAGLFWVLVAESWRTGGIGPSTEDYVEREDVWWYRILAALYQAGLTDEGGRLTEATWDKWSAGLIAKRAADAERKRKARASVTDRPPDSVGLAGAPARERYSTSPSTSRDVTDGDATSRPRADGDPSPEAMETYWPVALAVEALTQRPNAIGDPYGRMGDRVRQTIARHGAEATMAAYRAIAERAQAETGKPPTVRQLVFGADDRLDPIPTTRASDRDCPTCLNTGVTATGARCPDCHRGKADR